MKTINYLLLLILGLSLDVHLIYGQTIPTDLVNLVSSAEFIFEGTVIRSDPYWGVQNNVIYTSHTLSIKKILKGDLVCGTVEIITQGGRIGDDVHIISHNLTLYEGLEGVFFCDNAEFESSPIDF